MRSRAGWAWKDVLPYFRKLETDLDFDGELHGRDGPTPIRRVAARAAGRRSRAPRMSSPQSRQMAMIADMNGDFRDGYCALPMSNSPQRRASAALCYLDADVRARQNLTILQQATASEIVFDGRRAVGVKATVAGEAREFVAREIILCGRRHPVADAAAAVRDRARGGAAGARDRGARRPAGRRTEPAEPSGAVHRRASAPGGAPAGSACAPCR